MVRLHLDWVQNLLGLRLDALVVQRVSRVIRWSRGCLSQSQRFLSPLLPLLVLHHEMIIKGGSFRAILVRGRPLLLLGMVR